MQYESSMYAPSHIILSERPYRLMPFTYTSRESGKLMASYKIFFKAA